MSITGDDHFLKYKEIVAVYILPSPPFPEKNPNDVLPGRNSAMEQLLMITPKVMLAWVLLYVSLKF